MAGHTRHVPCFVNKLLNWCVWWRSTHVKKTDRAVSYSSPSQFDIWIDVPEVHTIDKCHRRWGSRDYVQKIFSVLDDKRKCRPECIQDFAWLPHFDGLKPWNECWIERRSCSSVASPTFGLHCPIAMQIIWMCSNSRISVNRKLTSAEVPKVTFFD